MRGGRALDFVPGTRDRFAPVTSKLVALASFKIKPAVTELRGFSSPEQSVAKAKKARVKKKKKATIRI